MSAFEYLIFACACHHEEAPKHQDEMKKKGSDETGSETSSAAKHSTLFPSCLLLLGFVRNRSGWSCRNLSWQLALQLPHVTSPIRIGVCRCRWATVVGKEEEEAAGPQDKRQWPRRRPHRSSPRSAPPENVCITCAISSLFWCHTSVSSP